MDFATRAIHAGQEADPTTGATITPIFQTSTYTQEGLGDNKGLRVFAHRQPDAHRTGSLPGRRWRTRASAWPLAAAWRPPAPS